MGRTVSSIAAALGAVALIATGIGAGAGLAIGSSIIGGSAALTAATAVAIGSIASNIATFATIAAVAAGAAAQLLTKQARQQLSRLNVSFDPNAFRKIVLGETPPSTDWL
jgi:hypothetical protein